MSTKDQDEVCSVCNGARIYDQSDSDKRDENGDIVYYPIECQHCHGTGIEPK